LSPRPVGQASNESDFEEAKMISSAKPIIQRASGIVRHTSRRAQRLARWTGSEAMGLVQRVRHLRSAPKPDMDDTTLARKVETKLFRPADAPKGSVDVNVADGVVFLRGEVKRPEDIEDLERRARQIPEVREVENLLHLHKTPAPTRADSPGRQRRTGGRRSTRLRSQS
jgi:osmotically-inducible protein OsmY